MPNDPYPFGGPGTPDDVLWHGFVVSKYGPDCTDNMGRVLEGLPVVENERIWRIYHETGRHHDKTDQ